MPADLARAATEPVEQPGPVLLSNPRAGVLDSEHDTLAAPGDLYPDTTRPAGVLAGVVNQDSGEAVDPLCRRRDPGVARPQVIHLQLERLCARQGTEPFEADLRGRGHVYRSGRRRWGSGVKARQPQQVVDDPLQPLTFARDALHDGGLSLARKATSEGELRLDDTERRPQLVRGIRRELELAATGVLDGLSRTQPDQQRGEEIVTRSTGAATTSETISTFSTWSSSTRLSPATRRPPRYSMERS